MTGAQVLADENSRPLRLRLEGSGPSDDLAGRVDPQATGCAVLVVRMNGDRPAVKGKHGVLAGDRSSRAPAASRGMNSRFMVPPLRRGSVPRPGAAAAAPGRRWWV